MEHSIRPSMSNASAYSELPHEPSFKVEPYTVNVPESELDALKALLTHTRIPKETFENSGNAKEDYGVTREWFMEARDAWLKFDWFVWDPQIALHSGPD